MQSVFPLAALSTPATFSYKSQSSGLRHSPQGVVKTAPDVFTRTPGVVNAPRFGTMTPQQVLADLALMAINGDAPPDFDWAKAIENQNLTVVVPASVGSREDGHYFADAPQAQTHSVLGLLWVRAALDKNEPLMTVLSQLPPSPSHSLCLGELVFDPQHAPAPEAYLDVVREAASSTDLQVTTLLARALGGNLSPQLLRPELLAIMEDLSESPGLLGQSVISQLAYGLGANPAIHLMPPSLLALINRMGQENVSIASEQLFNGLRDNPSPHLFPPEITAIVQAHEDRRRRVQQFWANPALFLVNDEE